METVETESVCTGNHIFSFCPNCKRLSEMVIHEDLEEEEIVWCQHCDEQYLVKTGVEDV